MNIEALPMIFALTAGLIFGFLYFGGLRFTVQRLLMTHYPIPLVFASFLLRLGGCLLGFYLVMGGHWERLVVCLLGFFLMRSILIHRWGPHRLTISPMKN